MRLTLLALLAMVATASSAQAQLPSHRASYQPRAATVSHRTTTTTSRMSNVEATVASHGYGEFGDGADGCPCGRPPQFGRNCCPRVFPDIIDNIFDPLICLVPTRAFCCPYPKVNTCNYKPSTYSACGCAHPLLNGIFACKKSCCQSRSSCSSCSSCTAAAPSCGCTSKGHIDTEVITPPMPESPFMDDPAEAPAARGASKKVKAVPPKTASNRSGWYKTSQPTPARSAMRLNAPGEIAIGNASPISIRE